MITTMNSTSIIVTTKLKPYHVATSPVINIVVAYKLLLAGLITSKIGCKPAQKRQMNKTLILIKAINGELLKKVLIMATNVITNNSQIQ